MPSLELKQLQTLAECKAKDTDLKQYVTDLKALKSSIEERKDFDTLKKIHKALSDKSRLLIFELLLEKGEMCICEFSIALEKTQPTISHHIQKLEQANLIEGIKSGKFIHYRIKKDTAGKLLHQFNYIEKEMDE
jgi:ArsR family transcriptional regulator, arsenate/arsenite/antimonite-responsive transcriptional repressor